MTAINFLHDRDANRTESFLAVNRILASTTRNLEFALEEGRDALSLILSENTYEELAKELGPTLENLQSAFGGFVDLGLIDANGNQTTYVGPYDLREKNYQGQDWFHEVLLRGVHISDVFMGYRNYPHIVVAFRDQKDNGDFYILRATIDMALIGSRVNFADMDADTDAFIVNHQGTLQTPSKFYGDILAQAAVVIPPSTHDPEDLQEFWEGNTWIDMHVHKHMKEKYHM